MSTHWTVYLSGEIHTDWREQIEVKVDLVVLGDGYDAGAMDKFHADARRLIGAMFEIEPFASRKRDFNVWAVDSPSERQGISRPRAGVFREGGDEFPIVVRLQPEDRLTSLDLGSASVRTPAGRVLPEQPTPPVP